MFQGDPRQQVQQLLNSGKVSQSQYNNAVQMANQLQRMLGK
jgi:vancomycin permeability regulator SanA